MRIFMHKYFHKWAKINKLNYAELHVAIDEIKRGLLGTRIGENLYKKRIAKGNRGKRSSIRTLVAYKKDERLFFIYGYAKNQRATITSKELDLHRSLADIYLNMDEASITTMLKSGKIIEVKS